MGAFLAFLKDLVKTSGKVGRKRYILNLLFLSFLFSLSMLVEAMFPTSMLCPLLSLPVSVLFFINVKKRFFDISDNQKLSIIFTTIMIFTSIFVGVHNALVEIAIQARVTGEQFSSVIPNWYNYDFFSQVSVFCTIVNACFSLFLLFDGSKPCFAKCEDQKIV